VSLDEQNEMILNTMKKILCLATALCTLSLLPVYGQNAAYTYTYASPGLAPASAETPLTTFSLDFPGGTPSQLVQAIEKAMGKPLNVIINREDNDVAIPPLKMAGVTPPQLFTALGSSSRKTVTAPNPSFPGNYQQTDIGFGFETSGSLTDTSVWFFYIRRPTSPPLAAESKACQFYSLAEFLNRGFTVEDITTAIQTGWKLSGETNPPELNYHKETKLLITYGEPSKLRTIDRVLQTLPADNFVHTRQQISDLNDQLTNLVAAVKQIEQFEAAQKQFNGAITNLTHAAVETPATLPAEKSGK